MKAAWAAALFLAAATAASVATPTQAACPADADAPKATWLSVRSPSTVEPRRLTEADLAALPQVERVQRRTVSAPGAASAPMQEQSVRYGGVLMRDLLLRTAPEVDGRGARTLIVEAVATDGYRALFAWGELFNSGAGEQVLVVLRQDGLAVGGAQGPVALRALADLRPGPRHVRNLCALVLRP